MKKWFLFCIALVAVMYFGYNCYVKIRFRYASEIVSLRQQLAHARIYEPVEHDTIRDTIAVASSNAIIADAKTLCNQHIIDQALIRDLGLKVKQLESVQTTTTITADSVKLSAPTSDTFVYHDKWSHIRVNLADSSVVYDIRDTVVTVVHREYRHHFLWWRWGTKGYRVRIVNFNPHTHVEYNTFVVKQK